MRKQILGAACSLAVVACSTGTTLETEPVDASRSRQAATEATQEQTASPSVQDSPIRPSASDRTAATPTSEEPVTAAASWPTTVSLDCPGDMTLAHGSGVRIDFGWAVDAGSDPIVGLDIDYGDGKQYSVDTVRAAKAELFWHNYEWPGSYTATVQVHDSAGRTVSDTCSFTFTWAPRPSIAPPPVDPGGGSGFGSGGAASGWFDCYYDGVPMWGDVAVVEYGADFDVRVVDFGADLDVKVVDFGANSCGEWRSVDFGADFTVRIVDFGADFDIRFVDFGPGR